MLITIDNCDFMDRQKRINSPRTLKACEINGVIPEELYFLNYKDYLSAHPEITNLPDEIKRYRFNLLEKIRLKTIKLIKSKRNELIEKKARNNKKNEDYFVNTHKKFIGNFESFEPEYHRGNMTFSEKMSNMLSIEKANIKKLKLKQKHNIEFIIEQQMKADLINYKNLEKERRVKENKEKKKKEIHDKGIKNQILQEEKKQRRINLVEDIMNKKIIKISTKHNKLDKKRNQIIQERNKKREELIQKRNDELIKISNHRSQLDIFRQEQEKKLIELKLNNEEKDKKILERLNFIKKKKNEINLKKRGKSVEIIKKNHDKKEEQLHQLIQKINKKHEENYKRLQEFYKELDSKNRILKLTNIKKKNNQENLLKSMELKRQKKISDYYKDNVKKDQSAIICKIVKKQKILNQKLHEDEYLELVQDHKQKIALKKNKKLRDLESKMEELEKRLTNYKKEEEFKNLKILQESFAKQEEKKYINKRIQRMKDYRFNLKEKEIKEKEKRLDLMKNEKLKFQKERKKLNIEMQNEKASLLSKFNQIIKGKTKIDCKIVKKLYPDDEELYQRVKKMQTIYNIGNISDIKEDFDIKYKEHSARNEFDRTNNNIKIKHLEEIEQKVEEFRRKLRQNIAKEIETERINETRRIKEYEEANDLHDKKVIEEKNKVERKNFGRKINDLNDNIEKYVDDYRKKLMEEFGYY